MEISMDMRRTGGSGQLEQLSPRGAGTDGRAGPMPSTNRPRKQGWLTPDGIARYALPGYLVTITVTWYMGVADVIPALYQDYGQNYVLSQRCIVTWIYVETMINWLCIRYVDSSYVCHLKKKAAQKRRLIQSQRVASPSSASVSLKVWDSRENLADGAEEASDKEFHGESGAVDVVAESEGRKKDETGGSRSARESPPGGRREGQGRVEDWRPEFEPPPGKTTFSYWSWAPCYVCELMRPPRCHHCPLCQTCVLKRDHHCYFAGACVGWRNQRHFAVFALWALVGVLYAAAHAVPFIYQQLWPRMTTFDLLAPVAVARWLFGYLPGRTCLSVVVSYLLGYFLLLTSGFVEEQAKLIRKGLTSFEVSSLKKSLELQETRPLGAKVRSVFGKYWALNVLLPMHWLFEAEDDPETWPHVKVRRH